MVILGKVLYVLRISLSAPGTDRGYKWLQR